MSATVERIPGVIDASLNFASGTLLVEYEAGTDPRAAIVRAIGASGHAAVSLDRGHAQVVAPPRRMTDRFRSEIATIGGGVFTALGGLLGVLGAPLWAENAAFGTAVLFGGLLVWRRALVALRARRLDMNVLMTIAVFGAIALGQWGEAATVFFLFALGGLLESRSLERTRRSIRDLMDLTPPTAHLLAAAGTTDVPVESLVPGDVVVVRPGERVPVDGDVRAGMSAIDEAPVTGESVPVDKQPGSRVYAGSLNTTGLLEVLATAPASDSTLARVVHLVEEAQASRAPVQRLVDRFSAIYTPTVVVLAALIAIVPPLLALALGADWGAPAEWVERALVMLVVACPCALVISTPVSIVSAVTRAGRDGVLVKGGIHLETAARVRAIAFDKTGTLTRGRPRVAEVVPLDGTDAAEVLALAAALERGSNHPIARAVVEAYEGAGAPTDGTAAQGGGGRSQSGLASRAPAPSVTAHREAPGRGVSGLVDGVAVEVTSPAHAESDGALGADAAAEAARLEAAGCTVLVVVAGGAAVGLLAVADTVRAEAGEVVGDLASFGIEHTVMLTGDNERTAEAVASQVGVSGFLARLLPQAKTDAVRVLQERYGTVAMVGDGVNDAPALAASDLGIAMGAAGTDTALETSDVALMADDLRGLPGFFALGRRTMRIIKQNVFFSIAVKFVVLGLAVAGYATLWMAVFADTGVSLLVILNGMRLLRRR